MRGDELVFRFFTGVKVRQLCVVTADIASMGLFAELLHPWHVQLNPGQLLFTVCLDSDTQCCCLAAYSHDNDLPASTRCVQRMAQAGKCSNVTKTDCAFLYLSFFLGSLFA